VLWFAARGVSQRGAASRRGSESAVRDQARGRGPLAEPRAGAPAGAGSDQAGATVSPDSIRLEGEAVDDPPGRDPAPAGSPAPARLLRREGRRSRLSRPLPFGARSQGEGDDRQSRAGRGGPREKVGRLLAQLEARPLRSREIRSSLVGHALSVLCRVLCRSTGWFLPMYFAGKLETQTSASTTRRRSTRPRSAGRSSSRI